MSDSTSKESKNSEISTLTVRLHFIYSICGLIVGVLCMIGGGLLIFQGVFGSVSWTTEFLGFESELSDASPGVVLFVIGLAVVYITRFRLTAEFRRGLILRLIHMLHME